MVAGKYYLGMLGLVCLDWTFLQARPIERFRYGFVEGEQSEDINVAEVKLGCGEEIHKLIVEKIENVIHLGALLSYSWDPECDPDKGVRVQKINIGPSVSGQIFRSITDY